MTPLTDPEREELMSIIRELRKERDDYRKAYEKEITNALRNSRVYEETRKDNVRLRREVSRLEKYNEVTR